MIGLHGRNDFELLESRHLLRSRDLGVLDAQAEIRD
jgi:hypothetical protein